MEREQLLERVKINYGVKLVEFRVYDTADELFKNEKDNLSIYANETSGEQLAEEDNVFVANGKWIYATEWYDADWDN